MKNKKIIFLASGIIILGIIAVVIFSQIDNSIQTVTTLDNFVDESQGLGLEDSYNIVDNNKKNNNKQKEGKLAINKNTQTDSAIAYSSYSICLENTKDGPNAKDCCDCLETDLSTRKACRDATVDYDFSKNTSFKKFEIPSILGANGDYSSYTVSGNQLECKQACEATTTTLVCGDFRHCRTACDNLTQ